MNLALPFSHELGLPTIPYVTPIVFVVDEDISVRASLELFIRSEGWEPETFASVQEFLVHPRPPVPNCLILAISHPDINGLEVQRQLARERVEMPIIVISSYEDIPTTVQAMKAGAVDFLVKPCTFPSAHCGTAILMMLKIERARTQIRLSGEFRSEHLDQVKTEIKLCGSAAVLDLEEVDLIDVEAVRFLNACEAKGISALHCSPYIREWMSQERVRAKEAMKLNKEGK